MLVRGLLLFLLFWVIARALWRLLEGVVRGASEGSSTGAGATGAAGASSRAPARVKMSACPVCGTYVVPGKAISLPGAGRTEYFCSDTCRSEYQSR